MRTYHAILLPAQALVLGSFLSIACQPTTRVAEPASTDEYIFYPEIEGDWWPIAINPDLGPYTSENQEPVDFGVWQATDGSWQLWSCIRKTNCGGNTRLFHGWEGTSLTDSLWTARGIMMEGDTTLGERQGGMQAPHVIVKDGVYHMLYGSWDNLCLATSTDGKQFEKVIQPHGGTAMFRGPMENTRDAMTLLIDGLYHTYYVGHNRNGADAGLKAGIFCRTSTDLRTWSEPVLVSGGGSVADFDTWGGGDAECPFVVQLEDKFVLFRNQIYGPGQINTQYCSSNPLDFGVHSDAYLVNTLQVAAPEIIRDGDQYYIAALNPDLDGIRMAKLKFVKVKKDAANTSRMTGLFGQIAEWKLLGPFQNEAGTGFDSIYPPEESLDFQASYPGQFYQQIRWKKYRPTYSSLLDLGSLYPGITDAVAYAHVRVWSPDARQSEILFGDDDAIKIWLNGELVHFHNIPHGRSPRTDHFPVQLQQGWNDLLVKMSDPRLAWRLMLRFDDPKGELQYAVE